MNDRVAPRYSLVIRRHLVRASQGVMLCIAALVVGGCSSEADEPAAATGGQGASGGAAGAPGQGGASGGSGGESAGGAAAGGDSGQPVTITFSAKVGDKPFACGQLYEGLGTKQTTMKPLDFRLYVHDIELSKGDSKANVSLVADDTWQSADVALLDFEDASGDCAGDGTAELNAVVKGTVVEGDYDTITFKVGVPFDANHKNQAEASSPLNLSKMWWSWASGYKFMKVDAIPDGTMQNGRINFHLGSTGCNGDPAKGEDVTSCANPNRPTIALTGFDVSKSVVVIDYARLVEKLDLTQITPMTAPGCMGAPTDPECAAPFAALGLDVATGMAAGQQTTFRVE